MRWSLFYLKQIMFMMKTNKRIALRKFIAEFFLGGGGMI